jgi:single-strand DNA-binding protein
MMQLTIAGNVGKDSELRNTANGDSVLSFSLAVDGGKDKNGNKRDSTWFDCSIWGKRADALQGYIKKGSKLVVTGRPTAREYQGKVYLGCTVQELTFMGGGQSGGGNGDSQDSGYSGGYGAPAGGGVPDPLDGDSIPFAPW